MKYKYTLEATPAELEALMFASLNLIRAVGQFWRQAKQENEDENENGSTAGPQPPEPTDDPPGPPPHDFGFVPGEPSEPLADGGNLFDGISVKTVDTPWQF